MQELVTTADVAAHLDITPSAVARRVRSGALEPLGKLPGIRGAYVFPQSVLDEGEDAS